MLPLPWLNLLCYSYVCRLWRMDQTVYTSVTSVFIATRVILLLAGVIACPGTLGISVSSHVRKVSLAINVNRFAGEILVFCSLREKWFL